MSGPTSRNLKIASASLFAIFIFACFFSKQIATSLWNRGEDKSHAANAAEDAANGSARKSRSKRPQVDVVAADAPEIVSAIEKIKHLEESRVEFTRDVTGEKNAMHEFYLKAPSSAEAEEINQIISQVHGFAADDGRGLKSWQERLREEYVMPSQYEGIVVTVRFSSVSPTATYSSNGIPIGKYARRDNGSVVSSDGSVYIGYTSNPFNLSSPWRFAYLFEDDGK